MAPRPWQRRSIDTPGETVVVSARLPAKQLQDLETLPGAVSYHIRQAVSLYKMAIDVDKIQSNIYEDWNGLDDNVKFICLKLLAHASLNHVLGSFSFGQLRTIAELSQSKENDALLMRSIQYLCGDRLPLLCQKFELADGTDIPASSINSASKTNILHHPQDGHVIEDFENNVLCRWTFLISKPNFAL